jgi:hypothetical protein
VTDAFGRSYATTDLDAGAARWPGLQPPADWTLFKVDGLAPGDPGLSVAELVLWHVAELPLESGALERVQFGIDEESNLLWAVERTVDGREAESRRVELAESPVFNSGKPTGDAREAKEYAYVPAQGIVAHWHPYTLNEPADGPRRLVQRSLADLSRQKPTRMPAPEAAVLQPNPPRELHQIVPLAVPSNGVEVERRWMLARDMSGGPVLWIQRQQRPLLSPPGRRLRFDVMEEAKQE